VIVRVIGRHQAITVTAGPSGPLYTATASDGKLIVASATLDELRERHPDLYRQLDPTLAVEAKNDGDARQAGDSSRRRARGESASGSADGALMLMSAE
jgi:hypothetical protein